MKSILLGLVLLAGCSNTANRRLLIIHEAKIVLRHSTTDPAWSGPRATLQDRIDQEDPDAR